MKILVTGACGYKGHILVPKLLNQGHEVIALDTQWFGNYLHSHPNLSVVKGNVRDIKKVPFDGVECVIHLASIANDPCGDLNPQLTWETSALATMQMADEAARNGVRHFIYASSGSVYGVSEQPEITEDLALNPISEYNKTKMVAERVVLSYADRMRVQIIRPATVCGLSPRMRLDVAVNMLTMQALTSQKITVFGGKQVRPNIHIDDITDVYLFMLERSDLEGIFNAGFENISIMDIAHLIQKKIPSEILVSPENDPRSYRINSDKLLRAGFSPKKNVENAIDEIMAAYRLGSLKNEEKFYNLQWMRALDLAKSEL